MGPEGSPRDSTVRASVGRGGAIADGRRDLRSGRVRTAHFPREVGEDGFAGVREPTRSVGRALVGPVVRRRRRAASADSVSNRFRWRFGTSTPAAGSLAWTARAVLAAAFAVYQAVGTPVPSPGRSSTGRYPIRPVLKHGPRSLACARVAGRQTLGRSESEGGSVGLRPARRGGIPLAVRRRRAHHRPVSIAASAPAVGVEVRRSESVHAGTRKMVNYA